MLKRKGFTLIELLVVVLIIGILAAIALPQYQVAVLKTRYTQLMVLADALRRAEDAYYLANGKYALSINDLDITIPRDCRQGGGNISCLNIFYCTVYDGTPGTENAGYVYCHLYMGGTKYLYYRIADLKKNTKRFCGTTSNFTLGKKVCESLGGKYNFTSNGVLYYTF